MRPLALPLLAAAFFAPVAGAQTPATVEAVERDLAAKRLQGAWVPDLLVTAGGAEAYPLAGRALVIDGTHFVRTEGRKTVATGTVAVAAGVLKLTAAERTPWDAEAAAPPAVTQYAFKVDGDLLTLCYSAGAASAAGDLKPGDGRTVIVYKRAAAK